MKHLLLLSIALLAGCGADSSSNSNPSTQDSLPTGPRLATELPGTWKADSSLSLSFGILKNVPAAITMQVAFATDGSFSSFLDASFMGNAVQGHLFTESGTWTALAPDTVVVRPLVCAAADTAADPTYKLVLPFHSQGGSFAANELKPSPCPDSLLITRHPVADTLRWEMPVTVPTQGKAVWTLAFIKQP